MCLNINNVRISPYIYRYMALLQNLACCAHAPCAQESKPQNCVRRAPPPCSQVSLPQNCASGAPTLRSVMRICRASTRGFWATERGRSKDRTSAGHTVCPREVRTRRLSEHVRGFATSERSRPKAEARAGLQIRISGAEWEHRSRFFRQRLLRAGGWGSAHAFLGLDSCAQGACALHALFAAEPYTYIYRGLCALFDIKALLHPCTPL